MCRRYLRNYVDAEDEARKARRGMWRGSYIKPWVWRGTHHRGHAPYCPGLFVVAAERK
jgi:endonuclease YncB( thermonuclease family)